LKAIQQRHPAFKAAVLADFRIERRMRGDVEPIRSKSQLFFEILRLIFVTDAFGALVIYRFKAACQRRGIPVVPRIAHRVAISWAQMCIGDPVVIHAGVRIPHGQVVIDGFTEIHTGAQIRPFCSIGLKEGNYQGPTIEMNAAIGTGARILGPWIIGKGARVGANAVVTHDVEPGAVVAGVPARRIK
jgi:serine O-acetyltransferase